MTQILLIQMKLPIKPFHSLTLNIPCYTFLWVGVGQHNVNMTIVNIPNTQTTKIASTEQWLVEERPCILEDQHMEWKPAGQPEHASLNQCQLIVANRCSGHPQQVVEIRFLCNVIDAGALIGPCSHVTSCCCLIC